LYPYDTYEASVIASGKDFFNTKWGLVYG
jgi:hypothetical protein